MHPHGSSSWLSVDDVAAFVASAVARIRRALNGHDVGGGGKSRRSRRKRSASS